MKNAFNKITNSIAKYSFILFVFLFSVANIFFTVRQYNDGKVINNYNFGLTLTNILIVLALILLLFFLNVKDYFNLNEKTYLCAFLLLVTLLGLYWILSNPRVLIEYDDSYNCFETAKGIINHDYGVLGFKSYVNTYPHNLPLITCFAIVIKIFGEVNAITVINLINLVFVVIGYLYLYKITKNIFDNRKTNLNIIFLMFLSLQFVFFAYYVYGNAISISLSLVSICYLLKFLKESKIKHFAISAIAISLSVAAKNNTLIVLIAEIIYMTINMINKKKLVNILLIIILILGSLLTTNGVIRFWEKTANYSYDNKLPKICWIGYGLNYDERQPGSYLNDFEKYHFESGYVVEYTKQRVMNFIKGELNDFEKDPSLVPKFLGEKLLIAWTNPEYGVFSYGHITKDNTSEFNYSVINGNMNELLNTIWDGALSVVSVGLLVYVYKRRKEIELQELILAIVFIGGFLFHSFWELKSIYMYHYYLCLLPYAAHGLMLLFNKK